MWLSFSSPSPIHYPQHLPKLLFILRRRALVSVISQKFLVVNLQKKYLKVLHIDVL